jgi:hypothetical protein
MINKAIIAAILSILTLIEVWSGWSSGITEEYLITVFAVLTPILVWAIPNKPWST